MNTRRVVAICIARMAVDVSSEDSGAKDHPVPACCTARNPEKVKFAMIHSAS